MLPQHAFNLHSVPTDTGFSTDILAAGEREAENAMACLVMSLLGSGTAFQNNSSCFWASSELPVHGF